MHHQKHCTRDLLLRHPHSNLPAAQKEFPTWSGGPTPNAVWPPDAPPGINTGLECRIPHRHPQQHILFQQKGKSNCNYNCNVTKNNKTL